MLSQVSKNDNGKGWQPLNDINDNLYRKLTLTTLPAPGDKNKNFDDYQNEVVRVAYTIDASTTCSRRKLGFMNMDKEAYNELRRIPKAMEYGIERKKAAHKAFKKVKKMNKRRQQDTALQQLGKAKSIWKPYPQQMKIDGKATCDRKLWIPAGERFQHDRYVDPG